ncbi:MAG TPA: hypothetical protein VHE13_15315 [Opitutus sp.]|nr:hypothetical protein [Opitutus sp.]
MAAPAKFTGRSLLLIVVALGVGIGFAVWFTRWRAAQPKPAVAIQDGKTIDFSSGRPVIKDNPAEKKIIADSVAEMDAAAKDVSFAPPAAASKAKPSAPPPAPAPSP